MPKQKDLKRLVRSRMQKTGEAYTAARLQVIRKIEEPKADLAKIAGMTDAAVEKQTGRNWAQWVEILDGHRAMEKPHREITQFVSSLGTPDWWTQMVTVGYERAKGLRAKHQVARGWSVSSTKTIGVPVKTLFLAWKDPKKRAAWLADHRFTVRKATAPKSMRITWVDGKSNVDVGFTSKGARKSTVAVQHDKLASAKDVAKKRAYWARSLEKLKAAVEP